MATNKRKYGAFGVDHVPSPKRRANLEAKAQPAVVAVKPEVKVDPKPQQPQSKKPVEQKPVPAVVELKPTDPQKQG